MAVFAKAPHTTLHLTEEEALTLIKDLVNNLQAARRRAGGYGWSSMPVYCETAAGMPGNMIMNFAVGTPAYMDEVVAKLGKAA